ncbi:MAG: response regulator [Flavobacteriales bacterium]|jgi:two-component system response regulator LytT|nr:response regulator [Flavobacteriales bacterium]MBK7085470.1 response regulator [Flavobacteriales bacterium]MBK7268226.1 response regulator [Flavobacteriales bacterium]MBK7751118.1 response regulator [Flavobacteriales bacterium]MBK8340415.1 response regulator [Flavobacteriales bacterium]
MAQTNVLVVEDESIVSKDIQHSLKKLGYNVVGAASTGEQAVKLAVDTQPDIILMDIMLKGEMNGIEAATQIRQETNIPVIFLTAYADESTLSKAKVTQPYGYIIKPFKEIDIHTSIEMALYKHKKEAEVLKERDLLFSLVENQGGTNDLLFVKSNSRLVKLRISDIYYIEALKDYVVINTLSARYTVHSTMKDIEGKLPENEFARVHRSFIVRIDKIVAIEQPNLILENDKKVIPVGGSYKDELAKRLKLV